MKNRTKKTSAKPMSFFVGLSRVKPSRPLIYNPSMHHRCDQCDQPATCHEVRVEDGVKTVKHLCDKHAAEAGLGASAVPAELLELLGQVVAQALPKVAIVAAAKARAQGAPEPACPGCGQTMRDFQTTRLLGCPECYTAFEAPLAGVIEQQHGSTHHVGKVPPAAEQDKVNQRTMLVRMRRRLEQAVQAEDYRLAARLRDEIKQMEQGGHPPAPLGGEAA